MNGDQTISFDSGYKNIMMRFMRTTLNINASILEELKERAATEKRPMTKVVNEVLRRGLLSKTVVSQDIKIPTAGVGIKAPYRGMSLNQVYDQIESESHLKVAEE